MNARSMFLGIIAGVLIALALAMPWYFVLPADYAPSWPQVSPWLGIVGYGLASLLVVGTGYSGARWGWATTMRAKIGLGAISGVVAAAVAWLLIGAGTAGIVGQAPLLQQGPVQVSGGIELSLLTEAIVRTVWFTHGLFWLMVAIGAGLGSLGGGIYALYDARVWGGPPRPTHPTIWLAVSMTIFLATLLALSTTVGIFSLLESRVIEAAARVGHELSLPAAGITLLPTLTMLAGLCAAIAWNWRQVAQRRLHQVRRMRRNRRPVIALTVTMSLLAVLLIVLINPGLVVVTYGIIVIAPLLVNLVGAYDTFTRSRPPSLQDEPLPVSGKDWLDYITLGWWIVATFIVLSVSGAGTSMVAIAIAYIPALAGTLPATESLPSFNAGLIRATFLYQLGIQLLIALGVIVMVPLFILYRSVYERVVAQLALSDQTQDAHRLMESCTSVPLISRFHQQLQGSVGQGPTGAILRAFTRISQDTEAALQQQSSFNQRLGLRLVEEKLDALTAELTRSGEAYSAYFAPLAQSWRAVVAAYNLGLTADVEARQEIDSPYIIGVPLTSDQELFVGRSDISARIEQLLLDRRRPPLLLYGQRRMGKTSLLNNLGRLLPTNVVPLFVDLQGPVSRSSDHAGMLYYMARSMAESALLHRQLQLPALQREQVERDPFGTFDEWLAAVEQSIGQGTALLMLDEFEALDHAISRGRFDEESVLGTLRHIIQHRPRFKIMLAGSHTLDEFRRWSSYLINVQVVQIGYLQGAETRQLVERPVQDFALRYEPAASERVLALTRGHPFLVQLLCAEIVALKNGQDPAVRRLARLADVEGAVAEALASGDMFFADIANNQVDAAGAAVLRALAACGEGAVGGEAQLAATERERLAETLRLLLQRDLIERAEGGYRFQVELIRRWFAEN